MVVGLGGFALVRTLAGQGHGQKPPVTLPRYATLESARSIQSPSMGLLRRPTPGEIVEDGRFSRPCGPGRELITRNLRKPVCSGAAIPHFTARQLRHSPAVVAVSLGASVRCSERMSGTARTRPELACTQAAPTQRAVATSIQSATGPARAYPAARTLGVRAGRFGWDGP